jgi:hypothetical protein
MGVWDEAPDTASWYVDLAEQHHAYRTYGVCRVRGFLSADRAAALAHVARGAATADGWKRVERDANCEGAKGRRASYVADAAQVHHSVPAIYYLIDPVRMLAETVVRRPVIDTDGPGSVTVKVYGPGDEQGPHRDSNPLTALLILEGAAPYFTGMAAVNDALIDTGPGDLLIFQGRRHWHSVKPSPGRVTAVYNLYHPEDRWRPAGQDRRVYG